MLAESHKLLPWNTVVRSADVDSTWRVTNLMICLVFCCIISTVWWDSSLVCLLKGSYSCSSTADREWSWTSVSVKRYVHLDYHTLLFMTQVFFYLCLGFQVVVHSVLTSHAYMSACVKNNFSIIMMCVHTMQKLIRRKGQLHSYLWDWY